MGFSGGVSPLSAALDESSNYVLDVFIEGGVVKPDAAKGEVSMKLFCSRRNRGIALLLLFLALASGRGFALDAPLEMGWVDNLVKLMPADALPEPPAGFEAARGEVEAIQLAVRAGEHSLTVAVGCTPFLGLDGQAPIGAVRVRLVGRVPVERGTRNTPEHELVAPAPDRFPDPLLEVSAVHMAPGATEAFWIDVDVPATAEPGEYVSNVSVQWRGDDEGGSEVLRLKLRVYDAVVPVERNLRLTNWFNLDPKWLGYTDAPRYSVPWWRGVEAMVQSMWAHRQNYFWTSLGEEMIPRLVGAEGAVAFDFGHFDRWVETFTHPQFQTYIEAQPISTRQGYDGHIEALIWRVEEGRVVRKKVEMDSPEAKTWYGHFLTGLRDHLRERGWLERFRLHLADEPHGHQLEPYRVLVGYVREFAPEFLIMEALDVRDDFEFFQQAVDVWVPQLGRFDNSIDQLGERMAAGKEMWHYTCLFPTGAYPNRFIDYPLIKTRLLHWINFKWGYDGYLHWGWNHWREPGPFEDTEPPHGGGTFLPPGDAWVVYPGQGKVLDSIRHEAMRDGVEDYELLLQLKVQAPERAAEIAERVIQSFTQYERDPAAFRLARRQLLEALEAATAP